MFQRLLKNISHELNRHNIPYMVIGGQALLLYGEPRLTKDIDITLGIGINRLEIIKQTIKDIHLKILVDDPEDFVKKTMVLPAIDKKGIRVDFIFSFSPYEKQAIKRGNRVKFGRNSVNFATVEDTVIHKIIAGRERDIEDIKSILLKNKNYDRRYITRWLRSFNSSLGESFLKKFRKIERYIHRMSAGTC